MSLLTETVSTVVSGNYANFGVLADASSASAVFVPIPRYADGETVTVLDTDYMISTTYGGVTTVVLPDPQTCPGRTLIFRSVAGYYIRSSVANIVPPNCVNSQNTCLYENLVQPTSYAWTQIVSNGTNWLAIAGVDLYRD